MINMVTYPALKLKRHCHDVNRIVIHPPGMIAMSSMEIQHLEIRQFHIVVSVTMYVPPKNYFVDKPTLTMKKKFYYTVLVCISTWRRNQFKKIDRFSSMYKIQQ